MAYDHKEEEADEDVDMRHEAEEDGHEAEEEGAENPKDRHPNVRIA